MTFIIEMGDTFGLKIDGTVHKAVIVREGDRFVLKTEGLL